MKPQIDPQVKTARRLLSELCDLAEHASMTRSLRGGEPAAARAFNGALNTLRERGLVPDGMFFPFQENDVDYGQLGVQSRLLLSIVTEEPEEPGDNVGEIVALAPFLNSSDLGQLVRERLGEFGRVPSGLLPALAPFLDSETLGGIVRRSIRVPQPPQPPRAPQPPQPPQGQVAPEPTPEPDLMPVHVDHTPAVPMDEAPEEEAPETLESLANQLRQPDLSLEERQRIAMRLAELSYEQSTRALG